MQFTIQKVNSEIKNKENYEKILKSDYKRLFKEL